MSNVIVVGSRNQAKVEAVSIALSQISKNDTCWTNISVTGIDVPSGVSLQPMSNEETLQGSIQRAKEVRVQEPSSLLGIGLEGGVERTRYGMFLCNWGAMIDFEERLFTAGGLSVRLPDEVAEQIEAGKELGDIMDEYAEKQNVRQKEGAIGILIGRCH